MLRRLFVVGLILTSIPASVFAKEPTTPDASVVEAVGWATVTQKADFVAVKGVVRGEGVNQAAALKALSTSLDSIEAGLARLAGADSVGSTTGDVKFSAVRPADCNSSDTDERPSLSTGKCAPVGVVATVDLSANVRPAALVGSAASLAVQLGLTDVSLGDSGVDLQAGLQGKAAAAAFQDAKTKADILAASASGRLGRVIRINRGVEHDTQFGSSAAVQARPPAKNLPPPPLPITPDVALKLSAPDVSETSWVEVEFEFLK